MKFIFSLLLIFCGMTALALESRLERENLGSIGVDEILIKPVFENREGQEAEFSFSESQVGFLWEKSSQLSAHLRIGSKELRNAPRYYLQSLSSEVSLVEAFGEYQGVFGRLRAGLVPLNYGIEGSFTESQILFRRPLFIRQRVVGLRDLGFSVSAKNAGFFTELTVHNGEGQANADDRMWFTAKWGWTDDQHVEIGWAGQTGTTKPEATTASNNTLAGVNNQEEAKWRHGGVFAYWHPNRWDFRLEALLGSVVQDEKEGSRYFGGYSQLGYQLAPQKALFLRYDQFDPNNDVRGDLKEEWSLAFAYSDAYKNSTLYFTLAQIVEEDVEINNNEFRMVWQLTPMADMD